MNSKVHYRAHNSAPLGTQVKIQFAVQAALNGPEGKQMYSSTTSLTSALDGVGWLTPRAGRLTPARGPVRLVKEPRSGPVRSGRLRKISSPPGFDPRAVYSVASRYTD